MYPQKNLKYGLYQKTGNDNRVLNFIFKLDIIPTSNIITQNCSCLKEKEGQRMEKRLKGRPSRDWNKEMQILAANHWTEQGDYNEGVKERIEEAEGLCNCVGGTTISNNKTTQSSQGSNHQTKSSHRSTNVCSFIYSRGLPYMASTGGESLGTMKAQYPSIGES